MKSNFFFILFLFISLNCLAQNWFPNGATWYYGVRENPFSGPEQGYLKVESVMDSVFMGKNCKVLQKTFFSSLNGDTIDQGYEILYSDSDKVYEYIYGNFYLLYDFSAHAGDTIKIKEPLFTGNSLDSTFEIIVDSVGVEIVNADTMHVQYISGPTYWYFGKKIIEKIGGALYLFPQNNFDFDSGKGKELRCYQDTVIGFYSTNTASACDYVTSISNITGTNLKIKIFPNPATDIITIKNISSPISYRIYNCTGQEVKSGNISGVNEIPIRELSSGLYMLNIFTSTNSYYNKFLKE